MIFRQFKNCQGWKFSIHKDYLLYLLLIISIVLIPVIQSAHQKYNKPYPLSLEKPFFMVENISGIKNLLLGELALIENHPSVGGGYFKNLAEQSRTPQLYEKAFAAYMQKGNLIEAQAILKLWATQDRDNVYAQKLSLIFGSEKKDENIESNIRYLLTYNSDEFLKIVNEAMNSLMNNSSREYLYNKIIEVAQDYPENNELKMYIYNYNRKIYLSNCTISSCIYKDVWSLYKFENFFNQNTNFYEEKFYESLLNFKNNKINLALNQFENAIEKSAENGFYNNNALYLIEKVDYLNSIGFVKESYYFANKYLKKFQNLDEYRFLMGNIAWKSNKIGEALNWFSSTFKDNDIATKANLLKIRIYLDSKMFTDAADLLNAIRATTPQQLYELLILKRDFYKLQGKFFLAEQIEELMKRNFYAQ